MRVAHIASYRPESANGVLVSVAKLTEHLARRGDSIEVWHFRRDVDRINEREELSGVRVIEVPFHGARHLPVAARYMPRASRHWIADRGRGLDGLHYHSVFQPESWYLQRLTSLPYAITPHGGYGMFVAASLKNRVKRLLWHLFERRLLTSAQFVHAVSQGEVSAITMLAGAVPVSVVHNGVDLPTTTPPSVQPHAPWLWIGRMHVEKKGLDLLIEGYAIASREGPLPCLVVRGPDFRGGRATVEALIRQHGLEDQIIVGGVTRGDEKRRLFEACSLFLHPSRVEGMPLTILEALGAARPVAVSPGTNLTDAVRGAGAGFVMQSHTAEEVAKVMLRAAGSTPAELTGLGLSALALAQSEFSWDDAARRIHALYDRHFRKT